MKNSRLFTTLTVAMLLMAAVIWWKHSRSSTENGTTETNEISEVTPTGERKTEFASRSVTRRAENGNALAFAQASTEQERKLAEMGVTAGMTKEQMQQRLADWERVQREKVEENWQKPIEFYGKVIDQNERSVSAAQVHFIWTDTSANGSSESNQLTDGQGQFALHNITGRMLQVWLSKDGYYVPKTNQNNFDYATGYVADPNNPVSFRLVKKGEGADLITSQHGMSSTLDFSVSTPDGSPVRVDFFNQKIGRDGQLEISQNKPAYGAWQTATGWSYRLAIPEGGFVKTSEEFPFEAPASGYQPMIEFKFQKGTPSWTERLDQTFYVTFGNPPKYGRIHVETTMTTGTILEYAINPDGSRNLEPKSQ
jgi:hypothetical protein